VRGQCQTWLLGGACCSSQMAIEGGRGGPRIERRGGMGAGRRGGGGWSPTRPPEATGREENAQQRTSRHSVHGNAATQATPNHPRTDSDRRAPCRTVRHSSHHPRSPMTPRDFNWAPPVGQASLTPYWGCPTRITERPLLVPFGLRMAMSTYALSPDRNPTFFEIPAISIAFRMWM
jgi:hypothetical protein